MLTKMISENEGKLQFSGFFFQKKGNWINQRKLRWSLCFSMYEKVPFKFSKGFASPQSSFFQWHSAYNSMLQPLLLSVFMQFKLSDGHDSFTLLWRSLNISEFQALTPHNNACKQFNNREGDCLILESWCSIKIPLWWFGNIKGIRWRMRCYGKRKIIIIIWGKSLSITFHIVRIALLFSKEREEHFARFPSSDPVKSSEVYSRFKPDNRRRQSFQRGTFSLSRLVYSVPVTWQKFIPHRIKLFTEATAKL